MPIRVERSDRIVTVILSRPELRNAVDPEHAEALYQVFLDFDADKSAEAAVCGEGGAFCAGADLKRLAARDPYEPSRLEFPKKGEPVPRGPMGPRASNSANRSSPRSKVRRSPEAWSSRFGPIAA